MLQTEFFRQKLTQNMQGLNADDTAGVNGGITSDIHDILLRWLQAMTDLKAWQLLSEPVSGSRQIVWRNQIKQFLIRDSTGISWCFNQKIITSNESNIKSRYSPENELVSVIRSLRYDCHMVLASLFVFCLLCRNIRHWWKFSDTWELATNRKENHHSDLNHSKKAKTCWTPQLCFASSRWSKTRSSSVVFFEPKDTRKITSYVHDRVFKS